MDDVYLRRLTGRDLAFLAAAGGDRGGRASAFRTEPGRIEQLIGSSEAFDALFAPWSEHPFTVASPFLVFSVLLAGTARELGATTFVREWVGPRQRIPVFDVQALRGFLGEPLHRIFLADVLASCTRVSSGSVWVRDRRGWTRRRFSELDPVRLAALLDVVPQSDRPPVYRRLGDLALFLSGVFPDAAERLFRPVQIERLERALAEVTGSGDQVPAEPPGAVGLLERLGRRSYRAVLQSAPAHPFDTRKALLHVIDRFTDARRVLNVITDRRLFPVRADWFPST